MLTTDLIQFGTTRRALYALPAGCCPQGVVYQLGIAYTPGGCWRGNIGASFAGPTPDGNPTMPSEEDMDSSCSLCHFSEGKGFLSYGS